jgi:hypothetical protein
VYNLFTGTQSNMPIFRENRTVSAIFLGRAVDRLRSCSRQELPPRCQQERQYRERLDRRLINPYAFADYSGSLVGSRMSIVGDAVLVHFMRIPINETFVVIMDQNLPLIILYF